MGMNRHTDINKNRILKTSMETYNNNNKRWELLKIHFINLRKKNFLRAHFCVIKQNLENIVEFL